jgi:hypothetical protein
MNNESKVTGSQSFLLSAKVSRPGYWQSSRQPQSEIQAVHTQAPNPSIERTNTGKPVFASHLKR